MRFGRGYPKQPRLVTASHSVHHLDVDQFGCDCRYKKEYHNIRIQDKKNNRLNGKKLASLSRNNRNNWKVENKNKAKPRSYRERISLDSSIYTPDKKNNVDSNPPSFSHIPVHSIQSSLIHIQNKEKVTEEKNMAEEKKTRYTSNLKTDKRRHVGKSP